MLFNIFVSELCLSKKLLIIFTTPNKSHSVYQVVPIPIPFKKTLQIKFMQLIQTPITDHVQSCIALYF